MFWSSGILTGNQTVSLAGLLDVRFWSSGILTGNQTPGECLAPLLEFWSSGILTGNQTGRGRYGGKGSFGAVAF